MTVMDADSQSTNPSTLGEARAILSILPLKLTSGLDVMLGALGQPARSAYLMKSSHGSGSLPAPRTWAIDLGPPPLVGWNRPLPTKKTGVSEIFLMYERPLEREDWRY